MQHSSHRRCHLRFSESEYQRLVEDAEVYGGSIASLIKKVYFRKNLPRPVMHRDDARNTLVELSRIGNNVNQLARHLNSGFREGFHASLDEIAASLARLKEVVGEYRGNT